MEILPKEKKKKRRKELLYAKLFPMSFNLKANSFKNVKSTF